MNKSIQPQIIDLYGGQTKKPIIVVHDRIFGPEKNYIGKTSRYRDSCLSRNETKIKSWVLIVDNYHQMSQ